MQKRYRDMTDEELVEKALDFHVSHEPTRKILFAVTSRLAQRAGKEASAEKPARCRTVEEVRKQRGLSREALAWRSEQRRQAERRIRAGYREGGICT